MAWPIGLRRVEGHSMAPRLLHGNIVVVTRWFAAPKVGDVVVVQHGGREKIKRITQIDGQRIFISGENRLQSTDSKDFGWLATDAVVAKLLWPRS